MSHGRVLVRPAAALAGQIEVRGLGIRQVDWEPVAAVGLVVDLGVADVERLPAPEQAETLVAGVRLPRLAVAAGRDPLPVLMSRLTTGAATT